MPLLNVDRYMVPNKNSGLTCKFAAVLFGMLWFTISLECRGIGEAASASGRLRRGGIGEAASARRRRQGGVGEAASVRALARRHRRGRVGVRVSGGGKEGPGRRTYCGAGERAAADGEAATAWSLRERGVWKNGIWGKFGPRR
ncbi:hypothetical protein QYE76_026454 [Lolium multiflorum]|uniref:Uncharacterized protein n=1 Tax=Lolium multiflorum TaxID=4521 RepID=A0AAD8RIM2_LOLMU|nr:hypothetical protein QYE76_026454 [Lolium multiflorum]